MSPNKFKGQDDNVKRKMFWFRWRLADLITEKLAETPMQLQWRKSLLISALRWLATTYKEHKNKLEKTEEAMLQRLKKLLVCIDRDYVNVSFFS